VEQHDAVVSFVPPTMHIPVLKSCLRKSKHLTTSSYVSPDMMKLHEEAKQKGLIFLNEVGLDPGIDIMSTMKVKDEADARGWKIVSYESYCGGLPVAEQANNPAIKASKSKATYRKNGKVEEAPEPLKVAEERRDISVAMKLEVYPNRDSLR
jgi:saccharopine dehydrogenase-like NADP-dependent oxidoreductase